MRVVIISTALLFLLGVAFAATPPIIIKGPKMFNNETGEQFWVRGVAYQPSADPLADYLGVERDLAYFQELKINVIRVYQSAGGTPNHDAVMKLLEDAGIYVMLDVSEPAHSINRNTPEWRIPLFNFLRSKVDAFVAYPNLLGFIAGNEVSNNPATSPASAFVKASVRDLKAYIKTVGYSTPVGYASADVTAISVINEYFDCGSKEEQNDFWGLNIYRWCGANSNFNTSGFAAITDSYSTWDVPPILTEYGCNINKPRTFPEVLSIYGPDMQNVFSGGIVFEYHQEENNYGLVNITGGQILINQDYTNFKDQISKVNPTGVTLSTYTPTNTIKPCPPVTDNWKASSVLPPTPSPTRCNCKVNQLECRLKVTDPALVTPALAKSISDAVNYVCSEAASNCAPIASDATTGIYGSYSMCNSITSASIALDTYYKATKPDGSCDFGGLAELVTPTDTTSTCETLPLDYKDHGGAVRSPITAPVTQTVETSERETGEYTTGSVDTGNQNTETGASQSTQTFPQTNSQSTQTNSPTDPQTTSQTTSEPTQTSSQVTQTTSQSSASTGAVTDDEDNSSILLSASFTIFIGAVFVSLI